MGMRADPAPSTAARLGTDCVPIRLAHDRGTTGEVIADAAVYGWLAHTNERRLEDTYKYSDLKFVDFSICMVDSYSPGLEDVRDRRVGTGRPGSWLPIAVA
jgi:hypothetical protein